MITKKNNLPIRVILNYANYNHYVMDNRVFKASNAIPTSFNLMLETYFALSSRSLSTPSEYFVMHTEDIQLFENLMLK